MKDEVSKQTIKIAWQQVLLEDSSVFSIQWLVLHPRHATNVTPDYQFEQYLHHIRAFTLSLIQPQRTNSGLEFRLLGTPLSLISFSAPKASTNNRSSSLTLRIAGGFLVQQENCKRGELSFISKPVTSGLKIILQLSDYFPLILGIQAPSRWSRTL